MTMLDHALLLAARGVPVFPCSPSSGKGGKRPLTPAESEPGAKDGGLHLATCDEAQIRAWWGRWPDALIGVPTGARCGRVVIDLDPREHAADAMRAALEAWCGGFEQADPETGELSGPAVSLTRSGGLHLWFSLPQGEALKNRANLFGRLEKDEPGSVPPEISAHVDVRGDGGYVIAPPSVMDNGNCYQWIEPQRNPPPLPARLRDLIAREGEFDPGRGAHPAPRPPRAEPMTGDAVQAAQRKYAERAMDRIVAELATWPKGGRNQELNNRSMTLGAFIAAGVLDEALARSALRGAADACGLTREDGAAQVEKTITSGMEAGKRQPRDLSAIGQKAGRRAFSGQSGAPHAPHSTDPDVQQAQGHAGADDPSPLAFFGADAPQPAHDPDKPDEAIVRWCSGLDHSDTDNGKRMIAHFGRNLVVMRQTRAKKALWASWDGRRWDTDTGEARAQAMAQLLGGRIHLEVPHIEMHPVEAEAIAAARKEGLDDDSDAGDFDKGSLKAKLAKRASSARDAFEKRKERRSAFATSSKNMTRIQSALACASVHLARDPDEFNANHLAFATNGHTLCFERSVETKVIHAGDPDNEREVEVAAARLLVREGHRRSDMITELVPVDYDAKARCPKWETFMKRMLPDEEVRRLVQVASGLGLIGLTVQRLFFHFGSGANGKSVYMETLTRLLGETAVTLPATSFTVEGGGSGQASPDVIRLYGKRYLRVKELPEGEDLRENFVKEATGGEQITARDLFSGYFDFDPLFTAHMSGNGYPRIAGTDEGIWRRMAVVHWPVQVPEAERRPFDEMIAEFAAEYPGILNWLIEGVLIYLREGLSIPQAVKDATSEYRTEMDPTADFCSACVTADPAGELKASDFYRAYKAHVVAEQGSERYAVSLTRFGKIMKGKYALAPGNRHTVYRVRLHDVPDGGTGRHDFEGHVR